MTLSAVDRIFRRLARSRGKGPMSLEFSFDSKKKVAALFGGKVPEAAET